MQQLQPTINVVNLCGAICKLSGLHHLLAETMAAACETVWRLIQVVAAKEAVHNQLTAEGLDFKLEKAGWESMTRTTKNR